MELQDGREKMHNNNMKRYLYLILGLFILFIVIIPFSVSFIFKTPLQKVIFYTFPTPTPIAPPSETLKYVAPSVISTSPTNGQTNVPVNTPITIIFNRPVSADELTFWVGPNISATTSISGNTLTATLSTVLDQGTTYGYNIKFKNGSAAKSVYFTTEGTGPASNTLYDPVRELQSSQDKQLHPDIYISNEMPYTGDLFHVSYSYTASPNSHIYFSVLLYGNNQNAAKQDFVSWVKSLGITDQQINTMDIRYSQPQGEL